MITIFETLGRRINMVRRDRGMTQSQLAELAGFSTSYIYKIESGNEHVTVRTLVRIAKALEIPVEDLLQVTEMYKGEARVHFLLEQCDEEEVDFICEVLTIYLKRKALLRK